MVRAGALMVVVFLAGSCTGMDSSQSNEPKWQPPAVKPWTPPKTSLPPEFVEAVRFLHGHGLADPRGGEFRQASVALGSVWGYDTTPTSVWGWVLPSEKGERPQIVTLQGLRYPTLSLGPVATVEEGLRPRRSSGPAFIIPEASTNMTAAMLLLAGETQEAERRYAKIERGREGGDFMPLATPFLSAWWDQAVTAHMRGDDALAYRLAADIAGFRDDYEREGTRALGEEWIRRMTDSRMGGAGKPEVFGFLSPAPTLAKDSWRRLKAGPRPKPDLQAIGQLPQDQRIKALIEALDEVSERQTGQPGGVPLGSDPIVRALVTEGDAAMESLFDAAENDPRLTRSVSFGRDFMPGRNLLTVRQAAFAAIQDYLQIYEFRNRLEDQPKLADIRKLWEQTRGMTQEERWLAVLRDDAAGRLRWSDAARSLFTPSDIRRSGGWSWTTQRKPGAPPPLPHAEALRKTHGSELAALLGKRARDVVAKSDHSTSDIWSAADALNLLRYLASWDPAGVRQVAPEVLDRTAELSLTYGQGGSLDQMGVQMGQAVDALLDAKVPDVLDRYVAWLSKTKASIGQRETQVFLPLVRHRDDPAVRAAARRLFLGEKSPWNLVRHPREGQLLISSMMSSPLLALEPVQEAIFKLLDDQTVVGEVTVDASGAARVLSPRGFSFMVRRPEKGDPFPAKPGTKTEYRTADMIMATLALLKGAPEYKPYWPLAERNRVRAEMKAYLRSNRSRMPQLLQRYQEWR